MVCFSITPSLPALVQTESWRLRSPTAYQLRGLLEDSVRVPRGGRKLQGMQGPVLPEQQGPPAPGAGGALSPLLCRTPAPITVGGSSLLPFRFRALGRQVCTLPGRPWHRRSARP